MVALVVLAGIACGGGPPRTPTSAGRIASDQVATAQAVAGATAAAPRVTPSPTPGAVAVLGPFRLWLLAVDAPIELAGRRPAAGETLLRVDVAVENAELRPRSVLPGALVSAGPGMPEDALLRFELETAVGPVAAAPDLYPALAPVVVPPGYLLRQTLLFGVPPDARPSRLVARLPRGTGQATLELAAAGKPAPPLPARAAYAPKAFAQGVDVLQGYQATLVAVAVQDGRVRARVEAQNKVTDRIEPGRLVSAQVVGADGDMRALEPVDAPTLALIDSKGSWEVVERAVGPDSWYAKREFRPVQILLAMRSVVHPDQVAEYATFTIPAEELAPPAPVPGLVTTLAGSTFDGYADGAGAAASFAGPVGIAVDATGTVYVGDAHNNRLRRLSPQGVVTTLAGGVTPGAAFADGPAHEARFFEPRGLAVDAAGTLYVGDSNNNRVRKLAPDGQVTTLAGGLPGLQDGPAAEARFRYPKGVAVDAAGNVYVADKDNHRIRRVAPDGTVSTLAGGGTNAGFADGSAADARFAFPEAVAVDGAGNVYVADGGNDRIRRIAPSGEVTTVAGGARGYADGRGDAARFNTPRALALDAAGTLFVADTGNERIRRVAPDGTVTTVAGSGQKGYVNAVGTAARFNEPYGIAVDPAGNLYVADLTNNRVRKVAGPN